MADKPEKEVVVVEQLVKCLGLRDHKCRIGQKDIFIEKNKDVKLTNDVATILSHAGVVMKR